MMGCSGIVGIDSNSLVETGSWLLLLGRGAMYKQTKAQPPVRVGPRNLNIYQDPYSDPAKKLNPKKISLIHSMPASEKKQ